MKRINMRVFLVTVRSLAAGKMCQYEQRAKSGWRRDEEHRDASSFKYESSKAQ